MNRRDASDVFHKPRRISNCFKDRDEELSFFRDLKNREKDQTACLLQPVSEEFEANGSFGLCRINSGGRKGAGLEFHADQSGKNDYNWLKTPPATPLFPSLEMEANGQELVMQREIPIIQPLSRFAGNSEENKTTTNNRATTPNLKPKLPQRHKTPTGRPSIPSSLEKRNMKTAPVVSQKPNITCTDKMKSVFTPIIKSVTPKESQPNFSTSNMSRSTRMEPNKPLNRGVSPIVRPAISGVSNETPPNLRTTNRPASATRGRPTYQNMSAPQKQDMNTNTKIRRQSCSPSVTRGRKLESDGNAANQSSGAIGQQGGSGSRVQVLGSRMVDKFMIARMSNADDRKMKIKMNGSLNESSRSTSNGEERQPNKIKLNSSLNESSGFGRLMSKNSLDMALKHMDIQRDSSNGRKIGMVPGRRS
ncbi:hypothetical protein C2S52_015141 [Perilla frutescens var. hirtella]|nr:hypothetical protein C2S52_015141 [Perilla frutescens var. hirtella]